MERIYHMRNCRKKAQNPQKNQNQEPKVELKALFAAFALFCG
jgi:hypothetical protein